jgi:hypothetical protein
LHLGIWGMNIFQHPPWLLKLKIIKKKMKSIQPAIIAPMPVNSHGPPKLKLRATPLNFNNIRTAKCAKWNKGAQYIIAYIMLKYIVHIDMRETQLIGAKYCHLMGCKSLSQNYITSVKVQRPSIACAVAEASGLSYWTRSYSARKGVLL